MYYLTYGVSRVGERKISLHSCQFPAELQHPFHSLGVVGFGVNPQYWLSAGESDKQPRIVCQDKTETILSIQPGYFNIFCFIVCPSIGVAACPIL